jgi:hypothetical protein
MSILSQRIFLGAALVLLFVLAACQASPAANQRSSTADQSYPPITLHDEADRYEFNTPESMCSALLVAEVTENGPESPRLSKRGMNGPTLFGAWVGRYPCHLTSVLIKHRLSLC